MSVNTYLYVDGVEYDLWPTFDGCYSGIGLVGLAANDSFVSRTMDVSLDYIKEGFASYGSIQMKDDEFSGSGFTSWDSYTPGTFVTLVEASGIAHLSGTGDFTGSPDITDNIVSVPWADYYFLTQAKVPVFAYPPATSGGYTSFDMGAVQVVIFYYSNGIVMRSSGLVGGSGLLEDHFVAATMDDGNWHSVGFRRHLTETCGFPPFTDLQILHLEGGAGLHLA